MLTNFYVVPFAIETNKTKSVQILFQLMPFLYNIGFQRALDLACF